MKTYVNPKLQRLVDTAEAFHDWPEAFDVCRERNRPIIANVKLEICKIFPSGHGKTLYKGKAILNEYKTDNLVSTSTGLHPKYETFITGHPARAK